MPRIPSESVADRGEDDKLSSEMPPPAPSTGSLSPSGHRRQHPLSLAESPTLQVHPDTRPRPKSMDAAILPLQTPSSSTFPSAAYNDPSLQPHDQIVVPRRNSFFGSTSSSTEATLAVLLILPFISIDLLYSNTTAGDGEVIDISGSHNKIDNASLQPTLLITFFVLLIASGVALYNAASTSGGRENEKGTLNALRLDWGTVQESLKKSLGVALPIFACLGLGGTYVAMLLLTVSATGLMPLDSSKYSLSRLDGWKRLVSSRMFTMCAIALILVFAPMSIPSLGITSFFGTIAMTTSIFAINPPFSRPLMANMSAVDAPPSTKSTSSVSSSGLDTSSSPATASTMSPLIMSTRAHSTLLATLITGFTTLVVFVFQGEIFPGIVLLGKSIAIAITAYWVFTQCPPHRQRSAQKVGFISGSLVAILASAVTSRSYLSTIFLTIGASVSYICVQVDDKQIGSHSHGHSHVHETKHKSATPDKKSRVTLLLLQMSEEYPSIHTMLLDKNSRGIFYFMLLNFTFMIVQATYALLTDSLGLMSDSIHMFFDCLALAFGLFAAVLSKRPPSPRFPYGFGKMDSLAGFGNGVFLIIISIEIIYEAVERLAEGREVKNLMELFVVSFLGLVVNIVGVMSFEHGHGHSHGHEGHSHHDHDHGSENLYGIYLHIVADILGSVAVVISTILIHFLKWPGFDPLASCAIAIAIFGSAIPLVKSSAQSLLLTLPDKVEYNLRDTLSDLTSLRGVVGYTVPKFWLEDKVKPISAHGHHHHEDEHDHGHSHHHDDHHGHDHEHHHHEHHHQEEHHTHTHSHSHSHYHQNGHGHDHKHDHDHDHNHDHDHDHASDTESRKILGVVHVIASRGADVHDLRKRIDSFMSKNGLDLVYQIEREGEGRCWCGGGLKTG